MDFWRMVVEHNVATMVMLTGPDSGSWQYWPTDDGDRTATYGCMTVTLVNRESRPSYVKREFTVCNTKVGATQIRGYLSLKWPRPPSNLGQFSYIYETSIRLNDVCVILPNIYVHQNVDMKSQLFVLILRSHRAGPGGGSTHSFLLFGVAGWGRGGGTGAADHFNTSSDHF